jgi:hypothetical protein
MGTSRAGRRPGQCLILRGAAMFRARGAATVTSLKRMTKDTTSHFSWFQARHSSQNFATGGQDSEYWGCRRVPRVLFCLPRGILGLAAPV